MKKLYGAVLAFLLAFALTVTPANASNFKDIPTNHSLKIEIDYLVQQGVIGGYQDGTFKPNHFIQKKHIAKMMAKALNLPKNNLKHPNYKDVSRNHPYYEDIAALYTAGIFSDAPYFKPDSYISRAFMAKILAEAFDLKSIAQNSVTYKDVNQSNPFYRYIQLVSMNQVATGYTHGYNDMSFQPNKILTRAHFSAFLARAMTLKKDTYTPNPSYTYYYDTGSSSQERLVFESNNSGRDNIVETFWKSYQGSEVGKRVYNVRDGQWAYGIPNTGIGTFIPHPFTIGVKRDTLRSNGYSNEKIEVLETNATIKVGKTTFDNVVVIQETTLNNNGSLNAIKIYLAPDYGVIGSSSNRTNKFLQSFSQRVAR